MKNQIRFLGIFLFLAVLVSSAHAALECTDSTHATFPSGSPIANGVEMLSLSSADNAHGEIPALNGYALRILCRDNAASGAITLHNDGTGSGIVNLLSLFTTTNSHMEIGGLNYPNKIMVGFTGAATGTLEVGIADRGDFSATNNDCPSLGAGFVGVVELSGQSNAHGKSPYSGLPAGTYPITVCLRYNASGTGGGTPANNMETLTTIAPSSSTIAPGATWSAAVASTNLLFGDPKYSNMNSLQLVALCDLDDAVKGAACAGMTSYTAFATDILTYVAGPGTTNTVPGSFRAENFRDNTCQSESPPCLSYSAFVAALQAKGVTVNPNTSLDLLTTASFSKNFSFDSSASALNLINNHHYRFLALDFQPYYGFNGVNQSLPEQAYVDNFAYYDFQVTSGSGSGCPPNCPTTGAGGDVVAIGNVTFQPTPSIKGEGTILNVSATNKRMDLFPSGTTMNGTLIVRDEDGNPVAGFNPATIRFTFPSAAPGQTTSVAGATDTSGNPIAIEASGIDNPSFVTGKTYTAYVSIPQYVDAVTPANSEVITANNATSSTFVLIEPEKPVSVPDAPWWMSFVFVGGILGWLFISSRKQL